MRKLKDVIKQPSEKELKVIKGLYDRMIYNLQSRVKVKPKSFYWELLNIDEVRNLPDGKYEIRNRHTDETVSAVIIDTVLTVENETKEEGMFFTHPKLFPSSMVEVKLPT